VPIEDSKAVFFKKGVATPCRKTIPFCFPSARSDSRAVQLALNLIEARRIGEATLRGFRFLCASFDRGQALEEALQGWDTRAANAADLHRLEDNAAESVRCPPVHCGHVRFFSVA
jgi:hypothetical protein